MYKLNSFQNLKNLLNFSAEKIYIEFIENLTNYKDYCIFT